ncbi:acetyl-CoA carboxylase carboxyltransferase subunit alpha [Helicovermis profundi]|uniref:Acetyl-coenzyme A carboxylase carboxyl transferase subunit alpha n=1 Tax=Helicovermis profundi TaxID=3065157 RepID=A0AAU9ECQ5_9FIRM|nr:acetyl-CoA carboxylase carboxyltransferase subunit alpha [Clostridia bacterium S502]
MHNRDEVSKVWRKVELARHKDRPTTLEYISLIFEDFIELHGDRLFSDDKAIVGGIAKIDGMPVTVIGHQKGRNVTENIKRNFGMAHPEGYRKSLRLMKQAEKFNRPIICFIDTPGAYCGIEAEERGQGEAIARNLFEMADLKVPVISIIIGEGGSGGALALGVGNKVYMLTNTIYSILSPEGFATILWKDSSKARYASEIMKITAEDLLGFNIIDEIIEEDEKGAHINIANTAKKLKKQLLFDLNGFKKLNGTELVEHRYNKFRNMGEFNTM